MDIDFPRYQGAINVASNYITGGNLDKLKRVYKHASDFVRNNARRTDTGGIVSSLQRKVGSVGGVAQSDMRFRKRVTVKRTGFRRKGAGTNVDSQYVGKFAGGRLRRVYRDKYMERGYKQNTETVGTAVATGSDSNAGPTRLVVQAVNLPQIYYTVAIAFLRHYMYKIYKKSYVDEDELFAVSQTPNYEVPLKVNFVGSQRTSQLGVNNVSATYTLTVGDSLRIVAQWLVTNVLSSASFGARGTQGRHLTTIAFIDRVNANEVTRFTGEFDKYARVTYYSKVECRLRNITNPSTNTSLENVDNAHANPLHGNVIYAKGFVPEVKDDNGASTSLVPFTFEDVANGVVLPKTYMLDKWYQTIISPYMFRNVEKAYNINLGFGQIKDFSLYYRKSCTLQDFINGNIASAGQLVDFTGTDAYTKKAFNRHATVQLEKYMDSPFGVDTNQPAMVNYHCEWSMGAIVSTRNIVCMPIGYQRFVENN